VLAKRDDELRQSLGLLPPTLDALHHSMDSTAKLATQLNPTLDNVSGRVRRAAGRAEGAEERGRSAARHRGRGASGFIQGPTDRGRASSYRR